MPFQAPYSGEAAGRPERVHARLCRLCVGRKLVGQLSDVQIQGGGQPFSIEPELQRCRSCSTDEQQIVRTCNTDGAKGSEQPTGAVQCDAVQCVQEQTRAREIYTDR
jgi:hypothetical protein